MSSPARPDVSTPSGPTVLSVPLFGGFWMTNVSKFESMP
jgi:hypothetical protein